jgi:hypothetical protein
MATVPRLNHETAPVAFFRRNTPADTAPQQPAPVQTDAPQVEPTSTESNLVEPSPHPVVLGSIQSAREQAVALVDALVETGYEGKSLSVGQLCTLHYKLSELSGTIPRGWLAIARELKRMGLPKVKLWKGEGGEIVLVTYYEIVAPPGNVVALARKA